MSAGRRRCAMPRHDSRRAFPMHRRERRKSCAVRARKPSPSARAARRRAIARLVAERHQTIVVRASPPLDAGKLSNTSYDHARLHDDGLEMALGGAIGAARCGERGESAWQWHDTRERAAKAPARRGKRPGGTLLWWPMAGSRRVKGRGKYSLRRRGIALKPYTDLEQKKNTKKNSEKGP